jgi:hypothetical protein
MKLGYADPPYFGCGKLYATQHPEALLWDNPQTHIDLVNKLNQEFDGWVLHTSATPAAISLYGHLVTNSNVRWCAWVKGFAAFKKNVPVAYAWEPVLIKAARKPTVTGRIIMRDWINCSITLQRGLTGAKPEKVCHWAFELLGAVPDDDLLDLFPGTGAVEKAWNTWRSQYELPLGA